MSKIPVKKRPGQPFDEDLQQSLPEILSTPAKNQKLESSKDLLPVVPGSLKKAAQKDFDIRNLRQQREFLESNNAKLAATVSQLTSQNKVLSENLRQREEECTQIAENCEKKLQNKDIHCKDLERNLEYYKNSNELLETKLSGIQSEYESDINAERTKREKLELQCSELRDKMRELEHEVVKRKNAEETFSKLWNNLSITKDAEIERLKAFRDEYEQLMNASKDKLAKVDEMEFEITDLKLKLKEYETSQIINTASKSLEKRVRDLEKEVAEKSEDVKFYKDLSDNTLLLKQQNQSLQQSNDCLTQRIEELLPCERKMWQLEEDLRRWNSVMQLHFPHLKTPVALSTQIQKLNTEINQLKSKLIDAKNESIFELSSLKPNLSQSIEKASFVAESDLERTNDVLKKKNEDLECRLRFLQNKLSLTERQRDSSSNLLSSFAVESEMSGDEKTSKVIEALRVELSNYKEMAEEYDKTVKMLRKELSEVYEVLNNYQSMTDASLSVLNQTETPQPQKSSQQNLDVSIVLSPDAEKTLSALEDVYSAENESFKVLTHKDDLVTFMKKSLYEEVALLKQENAALKEKVLKLLAAKQKMDETMAIGEKTMANCVQNSEEYNELVKKYDILEAVSDVCKSRLKSMKQIVKCLGFEVEFKKTQTETVLLVPIFRPVSNEVTLSDADSYYFELEKMNGVWHLMATDTFFYDAYSPRLQQMSHFAPFFASVISDLSQEFEPVA